MKLAVNIQWSRGADDALIGIASASVNVSARA